MATNVPPTQWQATDGLSEFTTDGVYDIANNTGINLVDFAGNQVVDTGVVRNLIPSTIYVENDGI